MSGTEVALWSGRAEPLREDIANLYPVGPDLDIWLATRCMTELVGRQLPARMAAFARGCLLASPRRRPQDAWRLLAKFDELLEQLYGPRTYRPFAMPA